MAKRPWITPQEVRDYSSLSDVQTRSDVRLAVDIARAEQYVISYTNNMFEDEELPQTVKTAVLLLAEYYGHNAVAASQTLKSETFDDYSYTLESGEISIESLGIAALLRDYVQAKSKGSVTMRMRRL